MNGTTPIGGVLEAQERLVLDAMRNDRVLSTTWRLPPERAVRDPSRAGA